MNSDYIFENIHYELAALYHGAGGNLEKINDFMLMVPECDHYPFLKRELDSEAHRYCCEATNYNLKQNTKIDDMSAREICCIVNELNDSCMGIDYPIEDWKVAIILHQYNACKRSMKTGILEHEFFSRRLKRIEELLAASLANHPELFEKKEETENERHK